MATDAHIPAAVVQAALADYGRMASDRAAVTPSDAVAEALAYVVRDLGERIARAASEAKPLTPHEYARLPHVRVAEATVRRWCRDGELPGAWLSEQGWLIPKNAVRTSTRKSA